MTLLHLSTLGTSVNISSSNKRRQQLIYICNANLLAASLARSGVTLTVITNAPDLVAELAKNLNGEPVFDVLTANFSLDLPKELSFRSAHFKIEAYGVVAKSFVDDYVLFLDADMVMIAPTLDRLISANPLLLPLYYDMTDQALASAPKGRVERDIYMLTGVQKEAFWCGGEFLGGDSDFYQRLFDKGMKLLPRYLANWREFNHVGDETITSATVAVLKASTPMFDAGRLGLVSRYWSGRTRHKQLSWTVRERELAFLHLPQDKEFLASYEGIASRPFDLSDFKIQLKRYHRTRSIRRELARTFYTLLPMLDNQKNHGRK